MNKEEKREASRRYYQKNKKKICERTKAYHEEHREFYKEYHKEYRQKHKEEKKIKSKVYREKNKDSISKHSKEYREKNAKRIAVDQKRRREENHDEYLKRERKYIEGHRDEINKRTLDRYHNNKNKVLETRRISRQREPIKFDAREALHYAVRKGIIERRNVCEVCGSDKNIHAHHEDYSKPLDVLWLCSLCHGKAHRIEPIQKGMVIENGV